MQIYTDSGHTQTTPHKIYLNNLLRFVQVLSFILSTQTHKTRIAIHASHSSHGKPNRKPPPPHPLNFALSTKCTHNTGIVYVEAATTLRILCSKRETTLVLQVYFCLTFSCLVWSRRVCLRFAVARILVDARDVSACTVTGKLTSIRLGRKRERANTSLTELARRYVCIRTMPSRTRPKLLPSDQTS